MLQIEPEDAERIVILRRLRALLFGYGPGWTFLGALLDWSMPVLLVLPIIVALIVYFAVVILVR